MIAEVSMLTTTAYVVGVYLGTLAFMLAWYVGQGLYDGVVPAVQTAREYYRTHPNAEPPNKLLVRIGLWGVR